VKPKPWFRCTCKPTRRLCNVATCFADQLDVAVCPSLNSWRLDDYSESKIDRALYQLSLDIWLLIPTQNLRTFAQPCPEFKTNLSVDGPALEAEPAPAEDRITLLSLSDRSEKSIFDFLNSLRMLNSTLAGANFYVAKSTARTRKIKRHRLRFSKSRLVLDRLSCRCATCGKAHMQ